MSVKRYEWMACDEHACHCDVVENVEGDMVDYEDYAAIDQKLAESQREFRAADATIENLQMQAEKLAAENAGLKAAIEKHADSYIMCGYCRTERDGKNDDVCEVLESIPATDAFLDEVRAQVAEEALKIMGNFTSGECGDSVYIAIKEFAENLRKGGAA